MPEFVRAYGELLRKESLELQTPLLIVIVLIGAVLGLFVIGDLVARISRKLGHGRSPPLRLVPPSRASVRRHSGFRRSRPIS